MKWTIEFNSSNTKTIDAETVTNTKSGEVHFYDKDENIVGAFSGVKEYYRDDLTEEK